MTIFAVTVGAVLGLPTPIVKLRETGVLRAFRVNGIPNHKVLLVQAISAFLHLSLVSIIILVTAPVIFDAGVPKNYIAYFITLLVLIFTSIALGLIIGVMVSDQSMATMLSQAIFLPSLLLSGIMFPASMLPKFLRWLGQIFPATHAMHSFTGMAFNYGQANYSGVLDLTLILLIGILAGGIALWRFELIGRDE
jgi:ABC-2 type transport system permease protein